MKEAVEQIKRKHKTDVRSGFIIINYDISYANCLKWMEIYVARAGIMLFYYWYNHADDTAITGRTMLVIQLFMCHLKYH